MGFDEKWLKSEKKLQIPTDFERLVRNVGKWMKKSTILAPPGQGWHGQMGRRVRTGEQ